MLGRSAPTALALLFHFAIVSHSDGFSIRSSPTHTKPNPTTRLQLADGNDDVVIGDDGASSEGQELASEFYQLLREREASSSSSSSKKQTLEERTSAVSSSGASSSASVTPQPPQQQQNTPPPLPKKKFGGGSRSSSSSSAGFFSGRGQSVYSMPMEISTAASSPRQSMMRSEVKLAEQASRNIGLQAALALGMLVVFVVVGLTGGITDGSERDAYMAAETSLEGLDQIQPEPSDTQTSVWL